MTEEYREKRDILFILFGYPTFCIWNQPLSLARLFARLSRTACSSGSAISRNDSPSSIGMGFSIGAGAVVGSGSVVTEDAPADALVFGRARQVNKPGAGLAFRDKAKSKKDAK